MGAAGTLLAGATALTGFGVLAPNLPPEVDDSRSPVLLLEFGTPTAAPSNAWFDVRRSISLVGESVIVAFEPRVNVTHIAFASISPAPTTTDWNCYLQLEVIDPGEPRPDNDSLLSIGEDSDIDAVLRHYDLNVETVLESEVGTVFRLTVPELWQRAVSGLACYLDRLTSESLSQSREIIYPAQIFAATPFDLSPGWRWVNETAEVVVPSSWTRVNDSYDLFGENRPRTSTMSVIPTRLTVELDRPLVFVDAERAQADAVWLAFWLTVVGAMLGTATGLLVAASRVSGERNVVFATHLDSPAERRPWLAGVALLLGLLSAALTIALKKRG
jgi:hypothetical protein